MNPFPPEEKPMPSFATGHAAMHPMDQFRRQYDDELAKALARVKELESELVRIKANHGCARHQGTTQFCAEAVANAQDKARLDWLEKHAANLHYTGPDMGGADWLVTHPGQRIKDRKYGNSPRTAIDAAIK